MKRKLLNVVLGLGMISVLGSAQATLYDRGGGLIYDDVLKITWLADANYAATQWAAAGIPTTLYDGLMNWHDAKTWAANLSFYDSVRNVTYTDWRLPKMLDPNSGYSEFTHMYNNNLGFKSVYSSTGTYQPDFGIFGNGTYGTFPYGSYVGERDNLGPNGAIDNLQSGYYWLDTVFDDTDAWCFVTANGLEYSNATNLFFYAWAVRPGDVADVAFVPEPSTLVLLGLAMAGLGATQRRACSALGALRPFQGAGA